MNIQVINALKGFHDGECMMSAIELLVLQYLTPSRAVFSNQWLLVAGYFAMVPETVVYDSVYEGSIVV